MQLNDAVLSIVWVGTIAALVYHVRWIRELPPTGEESPFRGGDAPTALGG